MSPTWPDLVPFLLGLVAAVGILGIAALAIWAILVARGAVRAAEAEKVVLKATLAEAEARHAALVAGVQEMVTAKITAQNLDIARCMSLTAKMGDLLAEYEPDSRRVVDAIRLAAHKGRLANPADRAPSVFKPGAKVELSDAQLWAVQCKKRGWKDQDGADLEGDDKLDAEALSGEAEKILQEARA